MVEGFRGYIFLNSHCHKIGEILFRRVRQNNACRFHLLFLPIFVAGNTKPCQKDCLSKPMVVR
jgi:hypothetical protein